MYGRKTQLLGHKPVQVATAIVNFYLLHNCGCLPSFFYSYDIWQASYQYMNRNYGRGPDGGRTVGTGVFVVVEAIVVPGPLEPPMP